MSTARPLFHPEPPSDPTPPPAASRHPLWVRILAWTAGSILVLLLLVMATIAILLHSSRFHSYVLSKVNTAASTSLNAPVHLENFALKFSPLTLDVYGVTVHGAAPYPDPPLLQVPHAQVGVHIVSLLQKKWYLENVRIDAPVVQVYVDKDGNSNIPKPTSTSNQKSNTTIFDLGVRHALLDHGVILYNGRKSAVYADLHDLNFRAWFTPPQDMYSGTLAYNNGRVLFGAYQPFVHNLDARFDLTPTTFQLDHATLSSEATKVNITATAQNFSAPILQARYQVDIDGGQMAHLLNNPSLPTGMIRATGTAHYWQVAGQPALDTLTLHGDLTSRRLVVKTPSLGAAIDDLAAHYSVDHGDATLHDLRASVLGGEITAQGAMKNLSGDSHSEMAARIRGVSLSQASQLAGSKSAPPIHLSGVLNADAHATWGKTMSDLVARADASIHGAAKARQNASLTRTATTQPPAPAANTVPIDSEIHATYTGANQQVALKNSYVHLPQTSLSMNGEVSKHSSLAVHLQANDLSQIMTIANSLRGTAPGQQPAINVAGRASFQGNVGGSATAPHLTGQLDASGLRVNGTAWKTVHANVDASPSRAVLRNVNLQPAGKGHISLDASVGLNKWAFTNTSPLQINLDASRLDVAELAKISGKDLPVSGTLNTHVAVHGTELNPIGDGTLSLTDANAYNQPISSAKINFNGTGEEAHAILAIDLPAGGIHGNVSVRPTEKTYTAQLTSSGIQLAQLDALKSRNIDATGVVSLNANGAGSFDNPQLKASVRIPDLTINKQSVKNVDLNIDMANHVANATLESAALNTSLQAKARVNLTGDYQADATIDTRGIPLQPIVAMYSPANAASLSGETELHATAHGPLKNKQQLEAHVTVPYLRVGYNNNAIQLASAAPIHADYRNGVVEIQHGAIRGTHTNLEFQGSIPVIDHTAPMSLLVQGNVDLQLAQVFNPDIRSSGQLKFNINSQGTTGRDINGEIDVVNASYASADLPVGLQNGNGVLTLTTDRLNIKSFQGTVGGGTVTAQGGVAYRPNVQFDLGLSAKDVRMLYPQGMRENINANIHLVGTTDNATLGGTVDLANLSFTPGFELGDFLGQFSSGVAAPPSLGITQNIKLNLGVHSSNNINLVSRTLSVNGNANLQVRGTAADPVILGRVNLSGGDIILHGDRFVLSEGTIQFVNPAQTEPVVNVTITTEIQQYNISMRFQGPVEQMRTEYLSDPALPQADILNLLAFGQTTGAAAGQTASNEPAVPASQQAESAVASQVTGQITSRIAKVAGISQLSISPVLGNSNNQGAGANITIQQRVTGNLFITFSTNTASTQSQVIQGQYQVSPRVAVSATRDPNGGFAFDTLIKKTW